MSCFKGAVSNNNSNNLYYYDPLLKLNHYKSSIQNFKDRPIIFNYVIMLL